MTIAQLISSGKPGRSHAWRVETHSCYRCRDENIHCTTPYIELWHYGTRMLKWYVFDGGCVLVDWSIGHGSVSDQNGCNIAFRTLNLPYRYNRAGGAEIVEI